MAQDFLTGLLQGISPPIRQAITTRAQQAQQEQKKQKEFANQVNLLFQRGQQAIELEKVKQQTKKPSITEQLTQGLQAAGRGEADFSILKQKFPTRIPTIERAQPHFTPVTKAPGFTAGGGIQALLSPTRAKITPRTQSLIDQIKTQADLNELLDRRDEAKKKGIDVDAILEYFGQR